MCCFANRGDPSPRPFGLIPQSLRCSARCRGPVGARIVRAEAKTLVLSFFLTELVKKCVVDGKYLLRFHSEFCFLEQLHEASAVIDQSLPNQVLASPMDLIVKAALTGL
jgi:hypothetical protein